MKYLIIINIILLMFFSSCISSTKNRFQPEKYFTGDLLPLAQAIYDDDAKSVKQFITQKGISVDTADTKYGYCLLLYAVNAESKSVVKTLLELGANPNQLSITKVYENNSPTPVRTPHRYPLTNATYKEDLYFAKILLKYDADPNLGNPLHTAIVNAPEKSTLKIFDLLLEHGSNINALNEDHDTPLYLSVFSSRSDYANYFLDHGANVNIICRKGETAAYRLQKYINRIKNEKFREDYIRKIQPTIDRFEARGIKFPVEKPQNSEPADTPDKEDITNKHQEQSSNIPQENRKKTWSIFDDDDIIII